MNAQKISRAFPLRLIFLLFMLLTPNIVLGQSGQKSGSVDSDKRTVGKEPITDRNSFSKPGPGGKWTLGISFDIPQTNDDSVPVVISKMVNFMGHKKWRNAKVTGLTLNNRSTRSVKAVQLRWIITSGEDRKTILLQGLTPFFETRIPAQGQRDVEPPVIDFAEVTKPLQKNETLDGDFTLTVRVSEVHFEDGFIWKEEPPASAFIQR